MATSPTEVMTVGEMIDAAITFNNDEPVVDFKMLEAVLYIIAGQLRVLKRKVLIKHDDYKQAQAKSLAERKSRLTVAQLKCHVITEATKGYTTTEFRTKTSSSSGKKRINPRLKSKDKSGKENLQLNEQYSVKGCVPGITCFVANVNTDWAKRTSSVIHDKILVVSSSSQGSQRDHISLIVTQEQYEELLSQVRQLQVKFGIKSTSSSNLHKQISLTEPMAAMNLATRLEASNKTLNEMLGVVTKFADAIPGIHLEEPFDMKLLFKSLKETTVSGKTSQTSSEASTAITKPERVVGAVDQDRQAYEVYVKNLATCSEFNVKMDKIRNDALRRISDAATVATETAKRASLLLTKAGPKLSQASNIGTKFSKLEILVDHFTKKINDLDSNMAVEISYFQERISNTKFDVDTMMERIFEYLAYPGEDPVAVAELTKEFAYIQYHISAAKHDQRALSKCQKQSDADLHRIQRSIERIIQVKTTRDELEETLKNKVKIIDINRLLSVEQIHAVVAFMQGKISQTEIHIESGESNWQKIMDKYISCLNKKCDRVQLVTFNNSLRKYCESMSAEVETMLYIFGDYRVNIYKKKLDRKSNCLSCGIPPDVKVSDKYMKFVKRILNKKALTQDDEITRKPCVPGQPIHHPLDPRALVCHRYCGASINKTEGSLSSTLGIEVVDINLTRMTDMSNKVHLACIPCSHSQETYVD